MNKHKPKVRLYDYTVGDMANGVATSEHTIQATSLEAAMRLVLETAGLYCRRALTRGEYRRMVEGR